MPARISLFALLVMLSPVAFCTTSVAEETEEPVRVRSVPQRERVLPGAQLAVAVVVDLEDGLKIWPAAEQNALASDIKKYAITTQLEIGTLPPAFRLAGPAIWPNPEEVPNPLDGGATKTKGFKHRAIIYVPIALREDAAPGRVTLPLQLRYQACGANYCLPPASPAIPVELEIVPAGTPLDSATATNAEIFRGFDPTVFGGLLDGAPPSEMITFEFFGASFALDAAGATGMLLLLLLAALGGLLLNFTPCVLPVIPLKVMSLSHASSNSRGRYLYLGVVMSFGVVVFFVALGAAVAYVKGFDSISSLFQRAWFGIAVGVLIALMGLGMMGLFSTRLPQWIYRFNPEQESAFGSFCWGILTAVLSTPCTAPFMGAAVGWATQHHPRVVLLTFGAIGCGMALPYLLLALNPKWVRFVPKSGPASELLKQTLGILLLAIAAFFAGTAIAPLLRGSEEEPIPQGYWCVVALFISMAALWTAHRVWRIARSPIARGSWAMLATAVLLGSIFFAYSRLDHGPIEWVYYTPARFDEAVKRGDVVVLDFTAEWCLNCKAQEAAVLHTDEVSAVLNGEGVTPIKVDITSGNPSGTAKLNELGWKGIPLLAVYGPGLSTPEKFDAYSVERVLTAIARARRP